MLLAQGVGSAEDIDRGMKLGTNQPMGPLQLADFIGIMLQLCDSASINVNEPHRPTISISDVSQQSEGVEGHVKACTQSAHVPAEVLLSLLLNAKQLVQAWTPAYPS